MIDENASFDRRESAAALFNVFPERTTRAMLAVLRIVVMPELHREDTGWSDCPNCKQSATGKYVGKLSCTRCGWNMGVRRGVL